MKPTVLYSNDNCVSQMGGKPKPDTSALKDSGQVMRTYKDKKGVEMVFGIAYLSKNVLNNLC